MITLGQLRKWYKTALKWKKVQPMLCPIIMELCLEVERLRGIADEQNAEYSDFTLMPFGQHKGKRLADVPDDYLRWWLRQNPDRGILVLEHNHGNYANRVNASKKLKLHSYIQERFNNDDEDAI